MMQKLYYTKPTTQDHKNIAEVLGKPLVSLGLVERYNSKLHIKYGQEELEELEPMSEEEEKYLKALETQRQKQTAQHKVYKILKRIAKEEVELSLD